MIGRRFAQLAVATLVALLAFASNATLLTQSGPTSVAAPTSPGGGGDTITDFQLTSTPGGTNLPFMVGQGFAEGDVPSGLDIVSDTSGVTLRAVCKREWNDGSCKHAVLVGTSTLTAATPKAITLKTGTAAGGTDLTCADIETDAPSASVAITGVGTVNLSSLLATPFRTWISTPEMVECHYRSAVSGDADLAAWFYVRMWAGGTNFVRAAVENGYLNGSPTTETHTVTVTIGGSTPINGTSITQYAWTRYDATGWIGTDPQITPAHNGQYLSGTKLVPNYSHRSPSETALNGLDSSYAPMNNGPIKANTSGTGFSSHIGPVPLWDALYVTSDGDPRAWVAVDVAARSLGSYSLFRRASATNRHPIISSFPTTTYPGNGSGCGGHGEITNGSYTWDVSHAPNEGFLAYLVTGDYYFYEAMLESAEAYYFCRSNTGGSGTSRDLFGYQNRAVGWGINIIGGLSALAPLEGEATADLDIVTDLRAWLNFVVGDFEAQISDPGQNLIGIPYSFSTNDEWTPPTFGGVAAWMLDFWGASNWRALDMEAFADPTDMQSLAAYMAKFTVMRFGPTGSGNYHFSQGGIYGVVVDPTATGTDFGPDETQFYDTPGQVWEATHGSPNAETTNTLQGTSGANPAAASGYWANALPALAAAVEHAATDAAAAWARLTGATNWPIAGSGADNCNDIPIFCVEPR